MKSHALSLLLALTLAATTHAQQTTDRSSQLIPAPCRVQTPADTRPLTIDDKTRIHADPTLMKNAEWLADRLLQMAGKRLTIDNKVKGRGIRLLIDTAAVKHDEGYRLEVNANAATITARTPAGAFYGIQTLLQLCPPGVYGSNAAKAPWPIQIAATTIEDAPAHPYRGMMLDVARYFYDTDFVKSYIDMMAMYKLNYLQLHLIDDSGWRLEIKKYPRLTTVGAWAGQGEKRLGGFYTQEEMRDLIDYAALRGITIIPEIEFPAHILSAIVAYPHLGCTGKQHELPMQHFISRDLLCAGKAGSITFLEDVMSEMIDLFPSPYINIGGDEAVYDRWMECPDCKALMEREHLDQPAQLQNWLANKVALWLAERGKTAIGWEEIFTKGDQISHPVVGIIWHDVADTVYAVKGGHRAILSPAPHAYFDFPEKNVPGEVKSATWLPPVSLNDTYTLPAPDYSPEGVTLGVQGCFWSDRFIIDTELQEIVPIDENRSERYAQYLTFPRMLALAEVAWTKQEQRDYSDFCRRLSTHFPRLDAAGCGYRVPQPAVSERTAPDTGHQRIRLSCPVEGAHIRYTTDGTHPTVHSKLYEGSIDLQRGDTLQAITVVNRRHFSLPLTVTCGDKGE